MKQSRITDHLNHLEEAAAQIVTYVSETTREEFFEDKRTQQAVILNLIVIGEVATRLLKEHAPLLAALPTVPWDSMRGMRNRIAHGYFEIDLAVVWETTRTSIPDLLRRIPEVRAAAASFERR